MSQEKKLPSYPLLKNNDEPLAERIKNFKTLSSKDVNLKRGYDEIINSPIYKNFVISEDGKTLIQPLTSIKGLGASAIEQILNNRPFLNAEDLLFREEVVYSKLNKKALDALCRGGALDDLVDDLYCLIKFIRTKYKIVPIFTFPSLPSFIIL